MEWKGWIVCCFVRSTIESQTGGHRAGVRERERKKHLPSSAIDKMKRMKTKTLCEQNTHTHTHCKHLTMMMMMMIVLEVVLIVRGV